MNPINLFMMRMKQKGSQQTSEQVKYGMVEYSRAPGGWIANVTGKSSRTLFIPTRLWHWPLIVYYRLYRYFKEVGLRKNQKRYPVGDCYRLLKDQLTYRKGALFMVRDHTEGSVELSPEYGGLFMIVKNGEFADIFATETGGESE